MLYADSRISRSERIWWISLLTATVFNCILQIARFWRFCGHQITADGINYIGLARHLSDGDLKASLHGYWSPLMSWLIAAGALFTKNYTLAARLVTIGSFLLCLPLLYVLTMRLWRSKAAAALAVFWFSTARGVIETAVGTILADFVLTACVLLYFVLLLGVLRQNRPAGWALLGGVHALAFLAKAIAMPWLLISSVLTVLLLNARLPRRLVASALLAFLFPAAVWIAWGVTLKTKYGVFTTGYQLRANLATNWHRRLSHYPRGNSLAFRDTSSLYDDYMVAETSWTNLQSFSLRNPQLLPMILDAEIRNVPRALKETLILLTPSAALALPVMLFLLARNRSQYRAEAEFTCIALIGTLCLILAYCMLVFDGRYVIPVVPVLIAICCPLILPTDKTGTAPTTGGWMQKMLLGLFVASTVFFAVYWASPFRTVDRDFEVSCYQAAAMLRNQESRGTLLSIGNGPYPEHGVGFEVGSYVSYLAGWRLVGGNEALPDSSALGDELVRQVIATKSDAVAVWGSPTDQVYERIVQKIHAATGSAADSKISDPYMGEVGTLILRGQEEEETRGRP